jgi:hypothetical protein
MPKRPNPQKRMLVAGLWFAVMVGAAATLLANVALQGMERTARFSDVSSVEIRMTLYVMGSNVAISSEGCANNPVAINDGNLRTRAELQACYFQRITGDPNAKEPRGQTNVLDITSSLGGYTMEFGNSYSTARASVTFRYWMHDNTVDEYYIPFGNAQNKENMRNLRATAAGVLNLSDTQRALRYEEREQEKLSTLRVLVESQEEITPRSKATLLVAIARGIMYVPAYGKAYAWKVTPEGDISLSDITGKAIGTKRVWTLNWPSWLVTASIMVSLYIAIQVVVSRKPNTPTTLIQVYRESLGMECNKRIYNMPSDKDFTMRLTADSQVAHYGLLGKEQEVQEQNLQGRRVLGSIWTNSRWL